MSVIFRTKDVIALFQPGHTAGANCVRTKPDGTLLPCLYLDDELRNDLHRIVSASPVASQFRFTGIEPPTLAEMAIRAHKDNQIGTQEM